MYQALEIQGLRKQYQRFALQNISFVLPAGHSMGLIGPNGAGKTTIIKLIMNLIRRDGGEIRVFGQDVIQDELAVKRRIGFVYDVPPFFQDVKLRDIAAAVAPFYPGWNQVAFESLMSEFELPRNNTVKKLSQGMQTKFALVLALSHNADLILMDEPTSGLDPVFRRDLMQRLNGYLRNNNKAILYSTHITTDLERTADYITLIREGRLIFSTTRDELLDSYAIVKGGHELLKESCRPLFVGCHESSMGVTALTADRKQAERILHDQAVIERASLEDIMIFLNRGE